MIDIYAAHKYRLICGHEISLHPMSNVFPYIKCEICGSKTYAFLSSMV